MRGHECRSRAWGARFAALALCVAMVEGFCPAPVRAESIRIADVLVDLLTNGIRLAPTGQPVEHAAHFTSNSLVQLETIRALNQGIGRQISGARLSSSAGGFAYSFDADLGVYSRATSSFGPIYGERPLTLGKGRFNVGINYRSFSFDKLDDLNLDDGDLYLNFEHVRGAGGAPDFEKDLVTARVFLGINSNVTSLLATYGATDRLDLGVVVPIASVDYRTSIDFHVERLFTADQPDVHRFPNGTDSQTTTATGTASGMGDLILRGKFRLGGDPSLLFAVTQDLRVPTGEERDLLGTGNYQSTTSLIGALNRFGGSVHFALGYAIAEGTVPEELQYGIGTDWAVDPKLTLAADLLGRQIGNSLGVKIEDEAYATAGGGTRVLPRMKALNDHSINAVQTSLGAKVNLSGNLLLTMNYIFTMTNGGLKDEATPLIGLDYSF